MSKYLFFTGLLFVEIFQKLIDGWNSRLAWSTLTAVDGNIVTPVVQQIYRAPH